MFYTMNYIWFWSVIRNTLLISANNSLKRKCKDIRLVISCCPNQPLHHAAGEGSPPIVQYIIEKGVNVEAKDKTKNTPVNLACQSGHLPIVQYFIRSKDKQQKLLFILLHSGVKLILPNT